MRHLSLLTVLFLAFLAVSCGTATNNLPKGKLFIIGGGVRPDRLVARMVDEANLREGGYVVILPMATEQSDSAIIWSGEQFVKQGLSKVVGFNFKLNETPNPQWIDSLKNASLIYVSGGNQNKFMEIVLNTPIYDAIHEAYNKGAVIAGTSAGAAVMSQLMITGNELRGKDYKSTFPVIESQNLEIAKGLGLLPNAVIDQHFVMRSRHNRLITAVIEHPELPGIGIDEATAILVQGNWAEVVGDSQVLVFRNPKKSRVEKNNKLGATDLKLSVYLPGDKFKIH